MSGISLVVTRLEPGWSGGGGVRGEGGSPGIQGVEVRGVSDIYRRASLTRE